MFYIFIGLLVLVGVAALALQLSHLAKAPGTPEGIVARPLLTANETEFFHRLQRALPDYYVFPQVALNAMLQVSPDVPKQKRGPTRNRFSQKHADYVVCERESLTVVSIIELDDRTHKAEKDAWRDSMLEGAGYRTIRFNSKAKPSEAEIAATVVGAAPTMQDDPELTRF